MHMPELNKIKTRPLPPVVKTISVRCNQTNPRSLIYGDVYTVVQHELRVSQLFHFVTETITHCNSRPIPRRRIQDLTLYKQEGNPRTGDDVKCK